MKQFFVLKMYLSEKVWEVINIEELNELWCYLDKLYGDKGKHIYAVMVAIKNLLKYTEDDVTKVINIISTTERAHKIQSNWNLKRRSIIQQ